MVADIDVMISLHCSSMAASAVKLKEYLESRGMVVWVCTAMSGGESYRDSIVDAIDRADVVIIMLNDQWALSGECMDEYNYAKRLNLTSYESGRSERGQPRLPVFCPIAFKNLNWGAHKHVRLLSANTNFIVHDEDDLIADPAKTRATFDGVAASLASAGKVLKDPIPEGVSEGVATAAIPHGDDVRNDISDLKDALMALTTRVVELESTASVGNKIPRGMSATGRKEVVNTAPASRQMVSGHILLGSNYLGNTLSEIRLNSKITGGLIHGLQAYYSITLSNVVHNEATGEVTFDAQRSREGFEWTECEHLNLGQEVKDELTAQFRESFTGKGTGTFNKTQRRLIASILNWTPNRQGYTWGKETLVLAAVTEGELVGFCMGNSTILMKEF